MTDTSGMSDADLMTALGNAAPADQSAATRSPDSPGASSQEASPYFSNLMPKSAVSSPINNLSNAELLGMITSATPHPVAGASGDLATDAGRFAGTVGANAAGAMLSLPNTLAQGVDWAGKKLGANIGAASALGSISDPSGSGQPLFPDFQTAKNMAFNTTGGTEYQPSTWLGRRGMDAATGAVFGLTGGVSALPAAIGGSATAGAAAEMFPDHPLLAGLLGFFPGAAAGKLAVAVPQRVAGAAINSPMTEPYAAFNRLELPTELSGSSTNEPGLIYAEKLAARMPGSEVAVRDARERLISAWQDKLNSTANNLGTAATPQEVGTSLQGAAGKWLTDFKNNTTGLWNRFHAMVPGDTQVATPGFRSALNDVLGEYGGADNLANVLQPGTARALSTALRSDTKSPPMPVARTSSIVDEFGNPIVIPPAESAITDWTANAANADKLPWQAVQSVRSAIGERLANPPIVSDIPHSVLKRLYAGLSQDMKNGAETVSPNALAAFNRASAATSAGHTLLDDYLSPIIKATSPESATQYAMAQAQLGGSRLNALITNLPDAAGDLAGYTLRNAANNLGSPTAFANKMTGRKPILSPEAQKTLFPNAETQQNIADLSAAGQAMQPMERDLANSPTSTHAARGPGRIIAAAELARQGHDLAGIPGSIAGGIGGLMLPWIAGKVAQSTALSPRVAALYGRTTPFMPTQPSLQARIASMPALGLPSVNNVNLEAPATSPNSFPQLQ